MKIQERKWEVMIMRVGSSPEILETIILIIKTWNVIVSFCLLTLRFTFITWIFILLIDMLPFSDLFLLNSLSCRAHSPSDWYIAGCFKAGVRFILRGFRSKSIWYFFLIMLYFWNNYACRWYMLIVGWMVNLVICRELL